MAVHMINVTMAQSLRCASTGVAPNDQQKQLSLDQYTCIRFVGLITPPPKHERQYPIKFAKTWTVKIVFIYLEETLSFTTQ